MPLYFFRCSASDGDHSDIWGISLPDADAALAMAVTEARSLNGRLKNRRAALTYRFEIEDEDGMPIMHVPLASALAGRGKTDSDPVQLTA